MARHMSALGVGLISLAVAGCSLLPMGGGGGGGGGGGYTPQECMNNQFPGDLSAAKQGQWVTYVTDSGASKISNTVKIVGKDGGNWWVEHWMDMGSMAYGYLYVIGSDKKIVKAWAAPKDGKEWKSITVKEPPQVAAQDGPKPVIKESDEKKEVKVGSFNCHRLDVTVNIQGKDVTSQAWYSKDAWRIYMASEHGGLIAMEGSGSKTTLDAKGEDTKPTIELPKN